MVCSYMLAIRAHMQQHANLLYMQLCMFGRLQVMPGISKLVYSSCIHGYSYTDSMPLQKLGNENLNFWMATTHPALHFLHIICIVCYIIIIIIIIIIKF